MQLISPSHQLKSFPKLSSIFSLKSLSFLNGSLVTGHRANRPLLLNQLLVHKHVNGRVGRVDQRQLDNHVKVGGRVGAAKLRRPLADDGDKLLVGDTVAEPDGVLGRPVVAVGGHDVGQAGVDSLW